MHHGAKRFPNSRVFDADHYREETKLASELAAAADYDRRDHYGYGSGRRLSWNPSRRTHLFLAIAKLLIWAFSIEPGLDEKGNPIEPDFNPLTGYSEGFWSVLKFPLCYPTEVGV